MELGDIEKNEKRIKFKEKYNKEFLNIKLVNSYTMEINWITLRKF